MLDIEGKKVLVLGLVVMCAACIDGVGEGNDGEANEGDADVGVNHGAPDVDTGTDGGVEPGDHDVAEVLLGLPGEEIHVDEEVSVVVDFVDEEGEFTNPIPVTWESSDPAVATVAAGVVRGVSSGTAVIQAQGGGVTATLEVEVVFRWASVAAADTHTCGLSEIGVAYCWGNNQRGQLGDGTTESRQEPRRVETEVRFAELALGDRYSCGRSLEGPAYCWGHNLRGQVGVEFWEFEESILEPRQVFFRRAGGVEERLDLVSLQSGREYTCGAGAEGGVFCWGHNNSGQVGLNPTQSDPVQDRPRTVAVAEDALEVGTAYTFACAATDDEDLWCWGRSATGTEGMETEGSNFVPPAARGFAVTLSNLVGGSGHLCGEGSDGLYCWGENGSGQLGQGDTEARSVPIVVGSFESATAYHNHTCGLLSGDVYCWGSNLQGQVDPTDEENLVRSPRPAGLPSGTYRSVAAGVSHSCAATAAGDLYCWGDEGQGRLGGDRDGDLAVVPRF